MAAAEAVPPMRGQLQKLGGQGDATGKKQKWQKRNFVLDDTKIEWTKKTKTGKSAPCGSLPLDEIEFIRIADTPEEGNGLKRALERVLTIQCTAAHKDSKQYFLAAADEEERDSWFQAIELAYEAFAESKLDRMVAAAQLELTADADEQAEKMQELKDAFAYFDTDGNGTIDAKEFGDLLRKMGQNPSKQEVKAMLKAIGAKRKGTITIDQFIAFMEPDADAAAADDDGDLIDMTSIHGDDGAGFLHDDDLQELEALLPVDEEGEEEGEPGTPGSTRRMYRPQLSIPKPNVKLPPRPRPQFKNRMSAEEREKRKTKNNLKRAKWLAKQRQKCTAFNTAVLSEELERLCADTDMPKPFDDDVYYLGVDNEKTGIKEVDALVAVVDKVMALIIFTKYMLEQFKKDRKKGAEMCVLLFDLAGPIALEINDAISKLSSLAMDPAGLMKQVKGKQALRLPITIKNLLVRAKDCAFGLPQATVAINRVVLSKEGATAQAAKVAAMAGAEVLAAVSDQLGVLNVGELRKRAAEIGVALDEIEAARDGDDPKGDIIKLILKMHKDQLKSKFGGGGDGDDGDGDDDTAEPEPEPEPDA